MMPENDYRVESQQRSSPKYKGKGSILKSGKSFVKIRYFIALHFIYPPHAYDLILAYWRGKFDADISAAVLWLLVVARTVSATPRLLWPPHLITPCNNLHITGLCNRVTLCGGCIYYYAAQLRATHVTSENARH